jgi:hypothetical protein
VVCTPPRPSKKAPTHHLIVHLSMCPPRHTNTNTAPTLRLTNSLLMCRPQHTNTAPTHHRTAPASQPPPLPLA